MAAWKASLTAMVVVFALSFVGGVVGTGDEVQFVACEPEKTPDGAVIPRNCDILALSIDRCQEPQPNQPCKIKRTRSASINFQFNTTKELQTATSHAYWANEVGDLPLAGMDTNTCNFTPCPIPAGQTNTFVQNLPLSKRFPLRAYDVKWTLENEAEAVKCCFIFKIRLVK